uniref:Putative secreted protein n=1 Tax=Amblyomma triste TaxID=251400 RepID=A0A023GB79_AMBTT
MLPIGASGLVFLVAALTGGCWAQLKPGCKVETLRACGDDYVPYGNRPHLPASGKEFEDECTKQKRQIACSVEFINDCLSGLSKTAGVLAVRSLQGIVDDICTDGSQSHKEYQKVVPCMNAAGSKLNACFQGLKSGMQKAVAKAPPNEVVPHTCCAYGEMVDCVGRALDTCEGGKEFLLRIFDRAFGKVLGLVCGQHTRGSEACKALPKLPSLGPKDRKIDNYLELLAEAAATFEQ